jgi:uncharacterized CHY-type Zn-finger protein
MNAMGEADMLTKESLRDKEAGKDIAVLADFIGIYCGEKHPDMEKKPVGARGRAGDALAEKDVRLCGDCAKLLRYAASMRVICPYNPKPACKKCATHCYKPEHRAKIREVMRFSGMHLITHGKLGLLKKYLF